MEQKTTIKTDCFGYRKGECKVLYELVCAERNCSFYKTCGQFLKDKRKYSLKRSTSI